MEQDELPDSCPFRMKHLFCPGTPVDPPPLSTEGK